MNISATAAQIALLLKDNGEMEREDVQARLCIASTVKVDNALRELCDAGAAEYATGRPVRVRLVGEERLLPRGKFSEVIGDTGGRLVHHGCAR